MYGSMDAEFEVQRTTKRAALTAFLCLRKRVIGPIKVLVDKKELWMGYGEDKETASNRELEMLIYGSRFGEELHRLAARDIVVEVEHVKVHRTKKEKREMSHFEDVLSLKAPRKRMSWQKQEQCWTEDLWRK